MTGQSGKQDRSVRDTGQLSQEDRTAQSGRQISQEDRRAVRKTRQLSQEDRTVQSGRRRDQSGRQVSSVRKTERSVRKSCVFSVKGCWVRKSRVGDRHSNVKTLQFLSLLSRTVKYHAWGL